MKKVGIFIAGLMIAGLAFSQNVNFQLTNVAEDPNGPEVVSIKITGSNVGSVEGLVAAIPGVKKQLPPMVKESGNNYVAMYSLTMDLAEIWENNNGVLTLQLAGAGGYPPCCMAIQIKQK